MEQELAEKIAALCHDHYRTLGKKGKPQVGKEWTLMAAVVMAVGVDHSKLKVVAMGTGSKCLGKNNLSDKGDLLQDSHAEVVARRAFIRFLYAELLKIYRSEESAVFCPPDDITKKCATKPNITFHLYISHTPCGDASIFPWDEAHQGTKRNSEQDEINTSKKQRVDVISTSENIASLTSDQICDLGISSPQGVIIGHETNNDSVCDQFKQSTSRNEDGSPALPLRGTDADHIDDHTDKGGKEQTATPDETKTKRSRIVPKIYATPGDIYRTGARCVPGEQPDLQLPGQEYHQVGVLRTKPGRGDPTCSMSCSDKMAKWCCLGIQGALLYHFLAFPVYVDTIIIGRCPYSEAALHRAVIERCPPVNTLPPAFYPKKPALVQVRQMFEYSHQAVREANPNKKIVPSASALIWYLTSEGGSLDVCVNGRRQGTTTKNIGKPESRCSLCKYELFKCFTQLCDIIPEDKRPQSIKNVAVVYGEAKLQASDYQRCRAVFLKHFDKWVMSPRHTNLFTLYDNPDVNKP